jgi:hypothetical protein
MPIGVGDFILKGEDHASSRNRENGLLQNINKRSSITQNIFQTCRIWQAA